MDKTLTYIFTATCAVALLGCQEELPDAGLVGTLWTLEAIEVPGEPDILPGATHVVSIQFSEDNRIEGQIDCNTYSGEYTLTEGDSMEVDMQYITEILCGTSIDGHYLVGLRAVHSYGIIGNQLRLYFDESALKYRYME